MKPHDFTFESHFAYLDGLALHYVDEGEGDVVLMVHGNPTWSYYYRNVVRALSGDYRCIVPDHIGCGLSDKPSAEDYPYTLEQRVDDLDALMNEVAPEGTVHLVVHDWGGMIGMAWAARHAERIGRIVVLNTAAFPLPESKPFPWPLALCRSPLGGFLIEHFNGFARVASRVAFKKSVPQEVRQAYVWPYEPKGARVATRRFVEDIPLKPSDPGYDVVAGVEAKLQDFADRDVLVCWGMKDFVFDHHFLAQWRQHWPQAEVHEYPDCGHYILEDAAPGIIEKIRGFFS